MNESADPTRNYDESLWRGLYWLSWLIVVLFLTIGAVSAWQHFDVKERPDGNEGHREIDFGGQWLMGRMIVEGEARNLYDRKTHRRILEQNYPRSDEAPGSSTSDAEQLLIWMMEVPTAKGEPTIGGPLYPPVHAFYYAPIGLMSPRTGYRFMQLFTLLSMIPAGLGITLLSRGRIWWPVSCMILILYPGLGGNVNLGQNAHISLLLLIWGWVALSRGRPVLAGFIWGFFAFKPVWAVTFCLVPFLTRRWRMLFSMIVTGTTLALLTIPFVGIESWMHWIKIGGQASALYNVDQNWVNMSRDILGLSRRWQIDFSQSHAEIHANWLKPTLWGWGMLLAIFEMTTRLTWTMPRAFRDPLGTGSAFLLLGVWFSCYHFMYYDVLLTALPVMLIVISLTKMIDIPRWSQCRGPGRPVRWELVLGVAFLTYFVLKAEAPFQFLPIVLMVLTLIPVLNQRFWRQEILPKGRSLRSSALALILITALVSLNHLEWYIFFYLDLSRMMIPVDQFCLFALWIWCAITCATEEHTKRQTRDRKEGTKVEREQTA